MIHKQPISGHAGSRFIAFALVLGLAFGGVGAITAQDDPDDADANGAALGQTEWPVAIHAGTCEEWVGEPAYDLGNATARITQDEPFDEPTEVVGSQAARQALVARATLDATFDELFDPDQPHVMLIHNSAEDLDNVIACGLLGGVEDDGRVIVVIEPVDESGFFGIADLNEDDAGFLGLGDHEVHVTVYLGVLEAPEVADATQPDAVSDVATEYAHPDWLVDAAWIDAQLEDFEALEDWTFLLLGVWPVDTDGGMLPGTTQIDSQFFVLTDTTDQGIADWRFQVESQLMALNYQRSEDGLTPDDEVVLYDDGTLAATGMWWMLDYIGHDNKRIIEGGRDAWVEYTGIDDPLPPAQPPAAPLSPENGMFDDQRNEAVLARIAEVQTVLEDENVVIIDTRATEDYAQGHIPGAVNLPGGVGCD